MDSAADPGPRPLPQSAFRAGAEPPGRAPGAAETIGAHASEASFLEPFERVFATLKRMASNYATLAVLDAQRAAVQLAWLIAGGIFATVLLVTAWLAAVIALAVWMLGSGMSWPAVLLSGAGLNLVGAAIVVVLVRGKLDATPFSALLRQIKSDSDKGVHAQ